MITHMPLGCLLLKFSEIFLALKTFGPRYEWKGIMILAESQEPQRSRYNPQITSIETKLLKKKCKQKTTVKLQVLTMSAPVDNSVTFAIVQ